MPPRSVSVVLPAYNEALRPGPALDELFGHLPRRAMPAPIRWSDRHGSRMRTRPRLAMRVASDLFRIPLIHRDSGRRTAQLS